MPSVTPRGGGIDRGAAVCGSEAARGASPSERPDIASVRLGVVAQAKTAREASLHNAEVAARVRPRHAVA